MNKIPELTQEQEDTLTTLLHEYWTYENIPIENVYLQALKIADAQGLLTKEASLDLKPDNWIEWRDCNKIFGNPYNGSEGRCNYGFIFHVLDNGSIEIEDNKGNIIHVLDNGSTETFNIVYCQNWLDEYLKNKE